MHCLGLSRSWASCTRTPKQSASVSIVEQGQLVSVQLHNTGWLWKDTIVSTASVGMYNGCGRTVLVDMYNACAPFARAHGILHKLPVQDIVTWNALITGYLQQGLAEVALTCFEEMQQNGFSPNTVTFACVLKACGSIRAIVKGQEIHACVVRELLLEKNIVAANAVVDMYAKCGLLGKAQELFDELLVRDVVSWNTLITAYMQHKHEGEALKSFERMLSEGLTPSLVTFGCILKACGSIGALQMGKRVHAQINDKVVQEKWKFVANALLDMYVKWDLLDTAQLVFYRLTVQDVVSWTVLIGGNAQHGCGEKALMYFERMQCESCSPNAITFVCVLKACGSLGTLDNALRVHAQIFEEGLFEEGTAVANALVDTYVKCHSLTKAQEVFNKLLVRDVISWNALISGYAQDGCGEEALNHFEAMQGAGLLPDAFTYACILKACGSLGAVRKSQEIHAEIVQDGLLEMDMVVTNALVDMYAKCGMIVEAQDVFDELLIWDVISWNALIAGYVQNGLADEAWSCFEQMQGEGFLPDAFTFASILKVCGSVGAAYRGQKTHDEIARCGLLQADTVLSVALIDMYAKLGMLVEAQDVFDELPIQDVASLNALLAGYSQLGEDEPVINAFKELVEGSKVPDWAIFTIVLNACSHRGLLDKAQLYSEIMSVGYGAILTLDQYACMVDLLGRAGHFEKAVIVLLEMPFHTNLTIWLSLLAACQKWGNTKLGKWAFENVLELDEENAAAYIFMSNIYAGANVEEIDNMIEPMEPSKQIWNNSGCNWWIDASGAMHSLAIKYKNHMQGNIIRSNLEHIAKKTTLAESISNLLQMSLEALPAQILMS